MYFKAKASLNTTSEGLSDMSLVHIFQACFVWIHDSTKNIHSQKWHTIAHPIMKLDFFFSLHITFLRPILTISHQPNIFLSTLLAVFFQLRWLSPTVRICDPVHTCEYAKLKQKSHQIFTHSVQCTPLFSILCFTLCHNPLGWLIDSLMVWTTCFILPLLNK